MTSHNAVHLCDPTLDLAPLPDIEGRALTTDELAYVTVAQMRDVPMHLRFPRLDDDERVASAVHSNLQRFLDQGENWAVRSQTVEGSRAHIERLINEARANRTLPYWNVLGERGDDGPIIGHTLLHSYLPEHKIAQLGVWIDKEYEAQGYAQRSVLSLLECARRVWKLEHVLARTSSANIRAQRGLERLGFDALDLEEVPGSADGTIKPRVMQWWGKHL